MYLIRREVKGNWIKYFWTDYCLLRCKYYKEVMLMYITKAHPQTLQFSKYIWLNFSICSHIEYLNFSSVPWKRFRLLWVQQVLNKNHKCITCFSEVPALSLLGGICYKNAKKITSFSCFVELNKKCFENTSFYKKKAIKIPCGLK